MLGCILATAGIVSTAILTRHRQDDRATPTTTAPRSTAGFSIQDGDALNFSIRRDDKDVFILQEGYRARFRCNPLNDHWVGTRRTPVHLGWSPWDAGDVANVRVDHDTTPERFQVHIHGVKPQINNAPFTTTIIGTRDVKTGRIAYGITSELMATPAEVKTSLGADRIEYIDPWIEGVFWHQRDDHDRELYQSFVFFDAEAQTLTSAPKLHIFPCLRDGTYETLVAPMTSGALALIDDKEPGLRFLIAALSGKGSLGICWWTWDPHFYLDLNSANSEKLTYAMKIEEMSPKAGARMLADATPIPFRDDPDHQLPTFTQSAVNRFDDMIDAPDEWCWEQYSRDCEIDRTLGYDDDVCLTIHGAENTTTAWYARTIGYDYFDHEPLEGGHVAIAQVRTRSVTEGARLGVFCYNTPESWLYAEKDAVEIWSDSVNGDNEWRELRVKFDGTGYKRFKIVLEQRGAGQSWFDNVELKRDPSADGAGWHDDVIDWRDLDWTAPQGIPLRAMKCSRPKMRSDPNRLVMAWKDCLAAGPRLLLPKGEYALDLIASGDGCDDSRPVLEIQIADQSTDWPIAPGGTKNHSVAFSSDGVSPVQLALRFANDGACEGPTGAVDMNAYVHGMTLRRLDPAATPRR